MWRVLLLTLLWCLMADTLADLLAGAYSDQAQPYPYGKPLTAGGFGNAPY